MQRAICNPFSIVRKFEGAVAAYTGATHAIAVDSCTNALFLCCKYLKVKKVTIPKKTYLSVPMSIIPYSIYDAAKRFTKDMYLPGFFMCLSFHIKKILDIGKGGMILTDNCLAAEWFRQVRYEGRHEVSYKHDDITMLGWNMYMTPEQAARGLALMQNISENNKDLGEGDGEGYRDLTEFTIFKNSKT